MSCTNPSLAIDLGVFNGVHKIKFLPKRTEYNFRYLEQKYGKENVLRLPCGKCDSCLKTYRKNWAIRCMCESKLYSENCFLTLTYDDVHYSPNKPDKKEDLQKFIHSLRDAGLRFRYFACGEYGSNSHRFHYHIIMFNYFPSDAKPLGKRLDNMYYSSDFLSRKWNKGNVLVGECSHGSCEYVAGYTNKKSELGLQAFLTMSNRPGIGYQYFYEHKDEAYKYGCFVGDNGKLYFPPSYFSKKFRDDEGYKLSPKMLNKLNDMSIKLACECQELKIDHQEKLYKVKASAMKDKLKKRGIL